MSSPTLDDLTAATAEGLRLTVRLQPGASRAKIEGLVRLDDGAVVLKARVTEPPEGGKANAALIKLLSKSLKIAKSAVEITAGQTDRRKSLLLHGDAKHLKARLAEVVAL